MNKYYARGRLKSGEMNKTEARYSADLTQRQFAGHVLWFKFEGIKLRLADSCFYTPDFAVLAEDGVLEFHEVKGCKRLFMDDAKAKIKVAAELYPARFFVIYPVDTGWEKVAI